jgi:hypothetical protein
LKVNDENRRIRIQDPDPDPDPNPDPLVRGMDPRIRIRIHPKMSWIRNTGRYNYLPYKGFHEYGLITPQYLDYVFVSDTVPVPVPYHVTQNGTEVFIFGVSSFTFWVRQGRGREATGGNGIGTIGTVPTKE